jgi:hypothetical protein
MTTASFGLSGIQISDRVLGESAFAGHVQSIHLGYYQACR